MVRAVPGVSSILTIVIGNLAILFEVQGICFGFPLFRCVYAMGVRSSFLDSVHFCGMCVFVTISVYCW